MEAPNSALAVAAGGEKTRGSGVRSSEVTPEKIRQLIDEGIAPEDGESDAKDTSALSPSINGSPQAEQPHFEATSKEAFFNRVETFTYTTKVLLQYLGLDIIFDAGENMTMENKLWQFLPSLKWAGKPHELSPLVCAKYGWVTVESDMLRCSSCQAFLCASLQPTFDFNRYNERCAELKKALCTAHEKFCFWPDSPCPDRFGILLLDEPAALLNEFLDRFQSLCHLDLQLPSLKPDDLKNMCLTEDKISLLLHLIEEELERRSDGERAPAKLGSDIQVHVTACILALCGWSCSSSLEPVQLSLITCSHCMRKVGLWSFQQIESALADLDTSFGLMSTPIAVPDGRVDRFPLALVSPRRMMTRSQDATFSPGSEQPEKTPGLIISRTRSWDCSSPIDRLEPEAASPTTRSRPVTRSMGQGDSTGLEVPSSPHRRAKRPRLCSSSSSDTSARSVFDPVSQHRDWCPWVNSTQMEVAREDNEKELDICTPSPADAGWKAVLHILLTHRRSNLPADTDSTNLSEKSRKVFRIFRQWESMCSS